MSENIESLSEASNSEASDLFSTFPINKGKNPGDKWQFDGGEKFQWIIYSKANPIFNLGF